METTASSMEEAKVKWGMLDNKKRRRTLRTGLLETANVPRYRDHKVAIYYTENDFAICRRESREAARWYSANGFDLTYAVLEKKGHERSTRPTF